MEAADSANRQLWEDPANWRCFFIYYAPEDPRTLVPKRPLPGLGFSLGWTLNFAKRESWLLMGGIAAVAYAASFFKQKPPPPASGTKQN